MNLSTFVLVLINKLLIAKVALSYPSGAPVTACNGLSPEPGHKVPSQDVAFAPYSLVQHATHYQEGDIILGIYT